MCVVCVLFIKQNKLQYLQMIYMIGKFNPHSLSSRALFGKSYKPQKYRFPVPQTQSLNI